MGLAFIDVEVKNKNKIKQGFHPHGAYIKQDTSMKFIKKFFIAFVRGAM